MGIRRHNRQAVAGRDKNIAAGNHIAVAVTIRSGAETSAPIALNIGSASS